MSKNKEEKYTLTIRMDSKTEQEIREKMDDAHVRSLNAFVLKAIDFYLGYLRQGKNLNYISPILASSIKSEIKNTEHNLSEIIFKVAVQLSMLTQIVADEKEFYPEYLEELQKWCAEKVASTNGITQNDLQQFYARLKKSGRLQYTDSLGEGLSDRMVRSCHGVCRTALDKAVQESLIRENPAIGCKLPPKKSREMQVLSPEEMQRFLIQARYDGYFEILLLALTTGMRRGEIMALQWDDLNPDTGELNIRRQVYYVKGEMIISEPKTKSSVRTIILPKSVVNVLAELKKTVKSRWIFPSPIKEDIPRNPHTVYKKMQLVLERSGCKKIRFHDLRHTFATTALANGMDVKTLSAMIGHVSSQTTLDIYLHSTHEMQRLAAKKIDGKGDCEGCNGGLGQTPDQEISTASEPKFEPVKGKIRKPGTGCISEINDHLYQGRYSPKGADGKRISKTVYAKTREECEGLLAEMIEETKAEIQAAKNKLKSKKTA